MATTPTERILRARLGAQQSWANTADRAGRTAAARQAAADRFEREVDPDGVLPPAERAQRAEHARRAHFTRLALKSAQSRRRAREARLAADDMDKAAAEAEELLADEPTGDLG